jgi:hypothetical protein
VYYRVWGEHTQYLSSAAARWLPFHALSVKTWPAMASSASLQLLCKRGVLWGHLCCDRLALDCGLVGLARDSSRALTARLPRCFDAWDAYVLAHAVCGLCVCALAASWCCCSLLLSLCNNAEYSRLRGMICHFEVCSLQHADRALNARCAHTASFQTINHWIVLAIVCYNRRQSSQASYWVGGV